MKYTSGFRLILLVILVFASLPIAMARARRTNQRNRRIALVIGNANYVNTKRLNNPTNDADLIAKKLNALGFEVVLRKNLSQQSMRDEIEKFSKELVKDYEVALFFYAGHGAQVKDKNYMIPVDAHQINENEVEENWVSVNDTILGNMSDKDRGVNIIILDACRTNSFVNRNMSRGEGELSGLAKTDRSTMPDGTLISYSTQAGNIAEDGANDRNSPFTSALANEISKPGIGITQIFYNVNAAVKRKISGQKPAIYSSLNAEYYFTSPTLPSPPSSGANTVSVEPRSNSRSGSITCPTIANTTSERTIVLEQFERGVMIAVARVSDSTFSQGAEFHLALSNDGQAWCMPETFTESPGKSWYSCQDAGSTRPEQSGVPWRGFGKAWCENGAIRTALGKTKGSESLSSAFVKTQTNSLSISVKDWQGIDAWRSHSNLTITYATARWQ